MNPNSADPARLCVAQWIRVRWWNACAWYGVTMADALARRGHSSFVMAPPSSPAWEQAARRGLSTVDVGDLGSASPGEWLRASRRLGRFLRERGIQAVNVHSSPGHARLAWECRRGGIALVRTRGDIRPPRAGPFQRWLYRDWTTHHLAVAEFIRREHYSRLDVPLERVTTIRAGLDLETFRRVDLTAARTRIRTRLGLGTSAVLVGMVGRLSRVKGHVHFLNALARVMRDRPQVHAVVVGPEVSVTRLELEEVARPLGIAERVHFTGWVEDALPWTASLDVAVISSVDSEAICRGALEFLGLGIPLVATRVHAIPEVVPEGVALLIPPADPEAMAQAIGLLVDSPEIRGSFATAGRRHVERHYRIETFGLEAETLLRRIVPGRRSETASAGS
jgi:glycosyltransferase involved in cell wall biosynthesis